MSFAFLEGKTVLVTGGTGSFGQKCVQMLLEKSKAKKIIILSRDELKQSEMLTRLRDHQKRLRFFIADVRDLPRLQRAFHGVNYVIHAAALKQVPALEYNPYEAVKTNVLGTQNVIEAAIDQGVERVVFLSSDKAASPINLYGATKLCAEKLVINGNSYAGGKTVFGVVRYGNVFGSRGSILRVIEEQRSTGEITLTHEDMTRFWITLEQGVNLVILTLESMYGGEIFIPKIPSMKVKDFMHSLAPECTIKIIGIRPGEKMHEMLVTPEEARHTVEFDNHYIILPEFEWMHIDAYNSAKKVPPDFFLASYSNQDWLDDARLKKLVQSL